MKKIVSVFLLLLCIVFFCSSCSISFVSLYSYNDLDKAGINSLKKYSDLKGEYQVIETIETDYGIYKLYKLGNHYSLVTFDKKFLGLYQVGETGYTNSTDNEDMLHQGTSVKDGVRTSIIYGKAPAGKKQLTFEVLDQNYNKINEFQKEITHDYVFFVFQERQTFEDATTIVKKSTDS